MRPFGAVVMGGGLGAIGFLEKMRRTRADVVNQYNAHPDRNVHGVDVRGADDLLNCCFWVRSVHTEVPKQPEHGLHSIAFLDLVIGPPSPSRPLGKMHFSGAIDMSAEPCSQQSQGAIVAGKRAHLRAFMSSSQKSSKAAALSSPPGPTAVWKPEMTRPWLQMEVSYGPPGSLWHYRFVLLIGTIGRGEVRPAARA